MDRSTQDFDEYAEDDLMDSLDPTQSVFDLIDTQALCFPDLEEHALVITGLDSYCDALECLVEEAEHVGLDVNEILTGLCRLVAERAVEYDVTGDELINGVGQLYNECLEQELTTNWRGDSRPEA